MSFIRRYGFYPSTDVVTQIEGIVVVDLPPPGAVDGTDTGVVGVVGEARDMTYAVSVDGTGTVTTNIRPQEIFSAKDLSDKIGGFDETLGDFGASMGNLFVALRNQRYSRLIVAPVNLCSAQGTRFYRQLPLCTGATNPLPVVPVQAATLDSGREFRGASGGRMRTGARTTFTALGAFYSGTGGATTNAAAAATQNFTVTGADFSAVQRPDGGVGVKKGDIVVLGYNNAGAVTPVPSGGNLGGGTYRVAVDAAAGTPTVLVLQQMQGGNFAFVTAATISFRIHPCSDADTAPSIVVGSSVPGGYAFAEAGGYSVPARPLSNNTGVEADGSWTNGTVLTPIQVPAALTGSSWNPLSGLAGAVHPSSGLTYTHNVQRPNAPSHATVDAVYLTSIDAMVSDLAPVSDVNVIISARTSALIRNKLKSHVLDSSSRSLGRMAIIVPELTVQTTTSVVGDADPGVGANRAERVIYSWPGVVTSVPEAVGFRLKTADGLTTTDGLLDVPFNGYFASVLSNLPVERNPGQAAAPVPTILASVLGIQRGVSKLELNDYITLRERGVAALRLDRNSGPIIQSGITTSLTSGEKNINRRRVADYIQDSLAAALTPFSKLPLTTQNKDSAVSVVDAFLSELKSDNNPAAQRIADYSVDDQSGNTPDLERKGIFVIIVRVRSLATGDFIVLQTEVGEGVTTITQLAA